MLTFTDTSECCGIYVSSIAEILYLLLLRRDISMLSRPRLKSHLQLAVVPDEGTYVVSSAKQVLLRGRLYNLVIPLLNGMSTDEICAQLTEQASPAEVFYTLGVLEKKGFLPKPMKNSTMTKPPGGRCSKSILGSRNGDSHRQRLRCRDWASIRNP